MRVRCKCQATDARSKTPPLLLHWAWFKPTVGGFGEQRRADRWERCRGTRNLSSLGALQRLKDLLALI